MLLKLLKSLLVSIGAKSSVGTNSLYTYYQLEPSKKE